MRRLILFYCLFLSILANACGETKSPKPATTPAAAGASAPTPAAAPQVGVVVPAEPVAGSSSDTYAYYLPKSAKAEGPVRVAIFLDSHARGKDPVTMYKALAEEFGFLLVGSNVSKNGQQPAQSLSIYDALLRDLKQKFKLDDKRITLAGFSGGARVAASIAQSRAEVVQVIGCSAGFQPRLGDAFGYFGIAGLEDFNYWEMVDLETALAATQQPYAFQFFPGGHAWPPINVMQNALEFSFFKWAPDQKLDDPLAQDRMKSFRNEFSAAQHDFDYLWQMRAYQSVIGSMGGWVDIKPTQEALARLKADKFFTTAQSELVANRDIEMKLRNEYVGQLGTKSVNDWNKLSADLRAGRISHPGADHNTDLRILNFLSLNTYFQCDGALKAGDLAAAEHFLQIYAFVDPSNSEHAYLTAVLRMRQGRVADALSSLKAARVIGFKDADRMAADPDLAGLRSDPTFVKMLAEMRAE